MAANGRRYGFTGTITGAATKTIWTVAGTAAVRPAVYDLIISSNATPADNSSEWQARRFTAAGTPGSNPTPVALDSGDPAATAVAAVAHSAEPTYTAGAILLDIAHNQRATFRWVAAPGSELVSPATAANGIGLQCIGVGGSGVAEISSLLFME